jgi:hypothetical protein
VADIGNMHPYLVEAALNDLDRQRIIKVAGGFRVNRDDHPLAEVNPPSSNLLSDFKLAMGVDLVRKDFEFLVAILREVSDVNMVGQQQGQGLCLEVPLLAQPASDPAAGQLRVLLPFHKKAFVKLVSLRQLLFQFEHRQVLVHGPDQVMVDYSNELFREVGVVGDCHHLAGLHVVYRLYYFEVDLAPVQRTVYLPIACCQEVLV